MIEKGILSRIDKQIGKRVKTRRKEINLSLKDFSDWFGIPYQQVQKYEGGENRIPASILLFFAQKLNVEISYFYKKIKCIDESRSDKVISKDSKKQLKVLIVEDNSVDEMLLQEAIYNSKVGCQTYVVHDGIAAIEFLKGQNEVPNLPFVVPDLIILDSPF